LFREAPHVIQFPPQCLHDWALTYREPGKEDTTAILQNKVDFEVHGGVLFPQGTPVTSYVDSRMSSTGIACFQFYFEKVVDINMNSVGHSKTQADMNHTLLTRPERKKKKAVRNAYNKNHATYEQLMKLVVCDKGPVLVTKSTNQLMQDLLHLQSGTAVVGGIANCLDIEKSGHRKRQKPCGSPPRKGNKDGR
jgi:hypothetical protein